MNADGTVYGRYGSRSSVENADKEMTADGLADAMRRVLAIHQQGAAAQKLLAGKQPRETKYRRPDDFPSLRGKFKTKLNYDGAVSKSCMHCHQVRDAQRQVYRDRGERIPDKVLFPYPAPQVVGLAMDVRSPTRVSRVVKDSPADTAGLAAGDVLHSFARQSIVSQADIQWALHHTEDAATVPVVVERDGRRRTLQMRLPKGWRDNTDISWRVTSWSLRRMGTGGILFEPASAEQRRRAGVGAKALALSAKHVGQYGAHGAAKRAGIRKGDILVAFDGQQQHMTTSQLLAYTARHTKPGQRVDVTVVRGSKRMQMTIPMQK